MSKLVNQLKAVALAAPLTLGAVDANADTRYSIDAGQAFTNGSSLQLQNRHVMQNGRYVTEGAQCVVDKSGSIFASQDFLTVSNLQVQASGHLRRSDDCECVNDGTTVRNFSNAADVFFHQEDIKHNDDPRYVRIYDHNTSCHESSGGNGNDGGKTDSGLGDGPGDGPSTGLN